MKINDVLISPVSIFLSCQMSSHANCLTAAAMEPVYRLMIVQKCCSLHLIGLQGLYARGISALPDDGGPSPVTTLVAPKIDGKCLRTDEMK